MASKRDTCDKKTDRSIMIHSKVLEKKTYVPITELTFLEVFFPKAQMQAHSAGTVKLARDH